MITLLSYASIASGVALDDIEEQDNLSRAQDWSLHAAAEMPGVQWVYSLWGGLRAGLKRHFGGRAVQVSTHKHFIILILYYTILYYTILYYTHKHFIRVY